MLSTAHQNISSHPDLDPVMEEEDDDSDDGCILSDLKRKKGDGYLLGEYDFSWW
jgi:hypothetical protein